MFHQVRHPPHGPPRITVGNEHRDGRLLEQQRRGSGSVALGMECAARGIGVEGTRVEIPEIEADQLAVLVAGEPGSDLRQQVVHSGIDQRDPHTGACGPVRGMGGCRGGDRGVQRLDARRPFQTAQEILDGACRPGRVVGQAPARHHIAGAVGHREEHGPGSVRGGFGVGRKHPAQETFGLDAVEPDARAVGEHQRVACSHLAVADSQRLARKLDRTSHRQGERGGRGIVRAAHRGDHRTEPLPDHDGHGARSGTGCGERRALRRGNPTIGNERRRCDQGERQSAQRNRLHA